MTDYSTSSGAGQLQIRDSGSNVEFWMYAPYRLNWNNLRFSVDANGTTSYFAINYNGSGFWAKVGELTITQAQTINFNLTTATGTSSIGGPTTLTASLPRGREPDAPGTPSITGVGSNYIDIHWNDGGDGGKPLDQRLLEYGTDPNGWQNSVQMGYDTRVSGLQKGVTYYFWAQAHNEKGWSAQSGRNQATTLIEPPAPTPIYLSELTQTSVRFQFVGNGDGGSPVLEYQIGYGTNPNAPTNYITSGGDTVITGLSPATTYYIWARARNSVGWSALSRSSATRTVAGAYITVGLVQKEAIPYVKDNGVWRLAGAWTKDAGVWKETR